jgi:hypothetical protein
MRISSEIIRQLGTTHFPTLAGLVAVDLLLVAVHVAAGLLKRTGTIEGWPLWHLGTEGSVPEVFNYLKWAALAAVLAVASRRLGSLLLAVLAALFLLVLLDDSLQFHERAGRMLAGLLGAEDSMTQAAGEIAYWLATGALFAILIAFGWRASSAAVRRTVLPLACLFGGVVVCGIGFDVLHALSPAGSALGAILGILEDGGEMVFASALLAYAVGAFLTHENAGVARDRYDRGT